MHNPDIATSLLGERSSYEIIPLGTNCAISHYLRLKGLRLTALPFDWNVTPIQSAIALIKNGFDDFLATENLVFLPPVQRLLFDEQGAVLEMKNDIITPVVCKKYGILFPHDFPVDYAGSMAAVRAKYQKRIERLTELLNSKKHLIFVHYHGALNDWQMAQYEAALNAAFTNRPQGWGVTFSAVLDENYPGLNYSLTDLDYLASVFGPVSPHGGQ